MYMLDTNVCLDFLLGRSVAVARKIEQAFDRLTVSTITAAELHVGSRTSQEPDRDARKVDIFLHGIIVAPFDAAAAVAYGEIARTHGVTRHGFDRLIAAHARALDLTLVTNNERDFAGITGVRIENWTR
jgi:tRNA(fMet)-specific endonuclease VapC